MTYARARLIVWNAKAYSLAEVTEAAIYILGTMGAKREDIDQAGFVL